MVILNRLQIQKNHTKTKHSFCLRGILTVSLLGITLIVSAQTNLNPRAQDSIVFRASLDSINTPVAQMEADGINVSEMNALLLKKVEELTLYIIEQNKELQQLKADVEAMKNK